MALLNIDAYNHLKSKAAALILAALAVTLLAASACKGSHSQETDNADASHALPDTLRVATLYSPASFFIYRDQEMGYDYSLLKSLVEEKKLLLDLKVATSLADALEMLDSGWIDLVAYEVPVTSEYKERVIACGPSNSTTQVLVQPRRSADRITDVTQLVGRDIYVEADSKYQQRIQNLNDELGGGINIHVVDRDTLITEDLIDMVSKGEIPLTVVDSDIARINKTYYPDLDITLDVSFPQRSSWAVAKNRQWLADSIDAWITTDSPRRQNALLLKRYFELSKNIPSIYTIDLTHGKVSPYDNIFKSHAKDLNWDWRLLASQAFVESRFNSDVVSWAGARGIMQIMPSTARAYKVDPTALVDPEVSVEVASRILTSLENSLKSRVPDPQERIKFILAAYNSGPAHIYDAIALAKKYGKNPQVWDGNVAEALLMKSNPEYYNDPVCKYGYFRGRQTTTYVEEVLDFYNRVKDRIPI